MVELTESIAENPKTIYIHTIVTMTKKKNGKRSKSKEMKKQKEKRQKGERNIR